MAITKIHRIHSTLNNALAYVVNGAKTEGKTLLSSFACADDPNIAAWQFEQKRNRGHMDKSNTLAHHLIQSFLPGEVDPDKAHQIGKKLADEYLDGKYQYVIATHVDKGHIHNHIIFNAISFTDRKWYKSYKKTYYDIRNLSDELCKENGLYVIPPSPERGKSYYEYTQARNGNSYKATLKETIDNLIPFCKDYEDLLSKLQQRGYELKRGKYVSVRASTQERFTRIKTLGSDYTEEAIIQRIESKSIPFPSKKKDWNKGKVVDIAKNKKAQESPGLRTHLLKHNLHEASQALLLIQSSGYKSIDEFNAALESRIETMEETRSAIRHLEDRQRTLSVAKEFAENFIDTQDIYKQYKKSKDPEKFLRSNETEIIIHETARDQLKAMGYDEVPHPKKLEKEMTENAKALATLNSSYSSEKAEVAKLNSVKKNIDKFMENDISRVKAKMKEELD